MADKEPKSKAAKAKKIIQKPLVVSEDGKLCSLTVADSSTSNSSVDVEVKENHVPNGPAPFQNAAGSEEEAEGKSENKGEGSGADPESSYDKPAEMKPESQNTTAHNTQVKPLKLKKAGRGNLVETKPKGKRGRPKKKDEVSDNRDDSPAENKTEEPKPKRAKSIVGTPSKASKKTASPNLSKFQLPSPPPTPPPPSETELAEAAAKSIAEKGRQERLRSIPYYYEEMKEIFEYLCDRNVYWKNDLPKNKKYSNRDTKLLEKEVRKKIADILGQYPKEKEVMEIFETEEERLNLSMEQKSRQDGLEEIDVEIIDAAGEETTFG